MLFITENKTKMQNGRRMKCVMLLAENLKTPLSASIAFDQPNTLWAKPKPV